MLVELNYVRGYMLKMGNVIIYKGGILILAYDFGDRMFGESVLNSCGHSF